ncbi:SDR family NAD(P)-dependent oxidoreductase [Sulfitobacter guttiformis]|uniref:Short-subunit dehydrogenase n=1 Tax=Sulfitobacter guttiformis TaxID=74349 RepID=A0A420DS50_9RHOB|nr:SDR family NAD(P)-dependent oxidoreductase [Sulfitobacter guttiformis]KIN74372.1 Oxidoreductase, short chain dehydrogenase/reductase family protein [Sulfitobacter guttiformis KCTC 32187]RKE96969.1 short-subunit dehydrogenase [Sulfitobacter guttiformis]
MSKTILITGATDGIGLEAAKLLATEGHKVLLHGRSAAKLEAARATIGGDVQAYLADLSHGADVLKLAEDINHDHARIDVLINNAGVLKSPNTVTIDGLDLRFMVNTIAPYILTKRLLPLLGSCGRIVNLSSAAQAPVDLSALMGGVEMDDMNAYAQSKLAITMWSQHLAAEHPDGPSFLSVNPGSLLATKMVKEGFGIAGNDVGIGAIILRRTALGPDFADVSGRYFDNDVGAFGHPHPDAADHVKVSAVVQVIDIITSKILTF